MGAGEILYQEYGDSAAAGRLHHPQRHRQGENPLASPDPLTSITIACQAAGWKGSFRNIYMAQPISSRPHCR